jgi:hypothetical protein
MAQPPSAHSGGAAPLSLAQRFIGILTAPKATFESVVSFPRWFGMFVVTTLLSTPVGIWFFWSEAGQQALLAQMRQDNPAIQDAQAQFGVMMAKYASLGGPVLGIVILLILSGILMGVFAITGGSASFKQVLAVVSHAWVVGTIATVVLTILNYVRGSMVTVTSLHGLGQAFTEHSFMANFLANVDLWWCWYLVVLAIGLGVLYRRRTAPIFISLLGIYLFFGVIGAALKTAFAGGS